MAWRLVWSSVARDGQLAETGVQPRARTPTRRAGRAGRRCCPGTQRGRAADARFARSRDHTAGGQRCGSRTPSPRDAASSGTASWVCRRSLTGSACARTRRGSGMSGQQVGWMSHVALGWGRSGLNRRPTDYEASQSRRSEAIFARFVLSWWSLVDPGNGPFSNWCATQVPHRNRPSRASRCCLVLAKGAGSAVSRPAGRGSPVAGSLLVTTRVCAVTSKVRCVMVTGCDAGTEPHPTGSKRGTVEVATAGAYGSQSRAGPCRHQRSGRY